MTEGTNVGVLLRVGVMLGEDVPVEISVGVDVALKVGLGVLQGVGVGNTVSVDVAVGVATSTDVGVGVRVGADGSVFSCTEKVLSCCEARDPVNAPLSTVAFPTGVSRWVVSLAVAMSPGEYVSVKSTGTSDRFQRRVTIPCSIPSSAGLSAHNSTLGLDIVSSE